MRISTAKKDTNQLKTRAQLVAHVRATDPELRRLRRYVHLSKSRLWQFIRYGNAPYFRALALSEYFDCPIEIFG
jgi:hypothetical protein